LIEGVFLGLVERVAVLMRAAMADQGDQAVQPPRNEPLSSADISQTSL
jgi:hypothetical protein